MVIAIIGVLVSLLMAAVFKVTGSGEQAMVRSEISQLSQGITAFMAKFSVKDPPPSRLILSNRRESYFQPPDFTKFKSQIHQDSYEYLMRLWPRLNWNDPTSPINWGGPSGEIELQGQECLVFFLGGIPTRSPSAGCTGFSTNPRNPTFPGGDRISFFDFKANRLVDPDAAEPTANGFFSYKDAYEKTPYAYFSSYKTGNRYNRYFAGVGSISECARLTDIGNPRNQVWPYAYVFGPTPRYLQPDTFQIISAGPDGLFGRGSMPPNGDLWNPKQSIYRAGDAGYDDIANFHDRQLGLVD
jgi:hypothetical protein